MAERSQQAYEHAGQALAIDSTFGGALYIRGLITASSLRNGSPTGALLGRVLRRDTPVTLTSVRLLHHTSPLDHSKATRELGWQPRPATEAIARAAEFYVERHHARL